jgi:hypothetical protein
MKLNKGDILIDRKTLKKYPVVDSRDGHVWLELSNRLVKRAMGQVIKHKNRFSILRVGQTLDKDYAFYCAKTDKMIILKQDTLFLGEV